MTTDTPTPMAKAFADAMQAIPAQHSKAAALSEALGHAEHALKHGYITREYADEVIRWARRSAIAMNAEVRADAEAARVAHLATRHARMERTIMYCSVVLALLSTLLLLAMAAAAYGFWLHR